MQRSGFGNSGWRPRATVVFEAAHGGGAVLRVRLARTPGVRAFWIGWPLVCLSIALGGVGHALDDPLNFVTGLALMALFGEAPALLTAIVWDHEPARLVDLIAGQVGAIDAPTRAG